MSEDVIPSSGDEEKELTPAGEVATIHREGQGRNRALFSARLDSGQTGLFAIYYAGGPSPGLSVWKRALDVALLMAINAGSGLAALECTACVAEFDL